MFARMTAGVTNHFRTMWPHLKPLRPFLVGFVVTGYLINKIPQSGKLNIDEHDRNDGFQAYRMLCCSDMIMMMMHQLDGQRLIHEIVARYFMLPCMISFM